MVDVYLCWWTSRLFSMIQRSLLGLHFVTSPIPGPLRWLPKADAGLSWKTGLFGCSRKWVFIRHLSNFIKQARETGDTTGKPRNPQKLLSLFFLKTLDILLDMLGFAEYSTVELGITSLLVAQSRLLIPSHHSWGSLPNLLKDSSVLTFGVTSCRFPKTGVPQIIQLDHFSIGTHGHLGMPF